MFCKLQSILLLFTIAQSVPLKQHNSVLQEYDVDLDKKTSRVINGEPVTDKKEYPFVVDLSMHPTAISSSRFCTGTLIAQDIVLTAAHCVLNDGYTTPIYATIGRIELQDEHRDNENVRTFRTIESIVHPEYDGLGSPKDVALLLLNASSDSPQVELASTSPNIEDQAWVVGYGIKMRGTIEQNARPIEVLAGRLQKTALRVKQNSFCDVQEIGLITSPGMICTVGVHKGSSACKGDSGGGLFVKRASTPNNTSSEAVVHKMVQVGIVSYGDSKCAAEDSGVFTDVASIHSWISKSVQRLRRAFQPEEIYLNDDTAKEILHTARTSVTGGKHRLSNESQLEAVKFYSINTNFPKPRIVTASLCNGAPGYEAHLFASNEKDDTIVSDSGSCSDKKLSKLSFKAGRDKYVVRVSSKGGVPFSLSVSSKHS